MRLFKKRSKNEKATDGEDKHEHDAETLSKGNNRLDRIVTASTSARISSVKQGKNPVNSADIPRDPCPSQEPDVSPVETNNGAPRKNATRNDSQSLTIIKPNDAGGNIQNTALGLSSASDVSCLKDMKRMLDPNTIARIAAPQPLNNFMHRLPTIERLEAEGLYTLVDPTIQLISEVTEEVGDQLTQLLSPRNKGHDTSNTLPRLTNGYDSGRAAFLQLPYGSQAAPNHSTQAFPVPHKGEIVPCAETEAFV
jgi:hypothetical protein